MGLTFWGTGLFAAAHRMSTMNLWQCLLLALIGGVFGNLLDSFLGATVQFSGYSTSKKCMVNYSGPDVVHISGRAVLSNTQVNFVSALTTSLLTASVAVHLA